MALNPEMWFISITTLNDAADFSNWLSGRRVECKDTMEFHEWLAAYNAFPLIFYLDGVVYSLQTRGEASIWLNAWNAAMNLRIANRQV
jgi:hypothetical protein